MLAWMLYAIVASILISGAALAFEHAMRGMRRPARFIWIGAMIITAAWPVAMLLSPEPARSAASPIAMHTVITEGVSVASTAVIRASEDAIGVPADALLMAAWVVMTVVLLGRLSYGYLATARAAREWRYAVVDGMRVRTSAAAGPAVVGITDMEVVIPQWALGFDRNLRDLVLAHEEEHRQSHDPALLLASAILAYLMPWNLGLLWQSRRLRLAIEIDCDTRVLRTFPDPQRYGQLLLAIAQKQSAGALPVGAMMSEPAVNLARRFKAMELKKISRVRLAAWGIAGVAAIVAACTMDLPTAANTPSPQMESPPAGEEEPAFAFVELKNTIARLTVLTNSELGNAVFEIPAEKFDRNTIAPVVRAFHLERTRGGSSASVEGVSAGLKKLVADIEKLIGESVPMSFAPSEQTRFEHPPSGEPEPERKPAEGAGALREAPVEISEEFAHQVPGTLMPVYPDVLKEAGVQGHVDASFVVLENGTVDLSTLTVHESTHRLFTEAVRTALATAGFRPARVNGVVVKQRIRLPFTFNIK